MIGLERTSPRPTEAGRLRHPPRQHLPRHPHGRGFAAVVLSGGYVEAGDTGRHLVAPGEVLLHRPWESHLDRIDRRGAEVLVLPIAANDLAPAAGRVRDPDAIVRLAERDRQAAAQQLLAELTPKPACAGDWPDLLALAICADPSLSLSAWAAAWSLHAGSLSRGFRQVFGLTPVGYRLAQRTRRAIDAVLRTGAPLSQIALDSGFADQAHMSRAIGRLAQATPTALRLGARR
jgi:AraC-like DNA-binding protein